MVEWDHNLKNSLCYVLVSHNNSNETENEQKKAIVYLVAFYKPFSYSANETEQQRR